MNENNLAVPEPSSHPSTSSSGSSASANGSKIVQVLARQDMSIPRLAAWIGLLVAFTIGWAIFGMAFGGNDSGSAAAGGVEGALGLLITSAAAGTMAWMLRAGRRHKQSLYDWIQDGRAGGSSYRVGGWRGFLWGSASLVSLITGVALLNSLATGASGSTSVRNLGTGFVYTLCGFAGSTKLVSRWRISLRASRVRESERLQRWDDKLATESTSAGLELNAEALAALHGPAGTRRRHQLHRLSTAKSGVDHVEYYVHWNEWFSITVVLVLVLVGAVVSHRGMTHGSFGLQVRILIALSVWAALVVFYFLPFRISHLRQRRALLAAAESIGEANSYQVAVPARMGKNEGLLVEESGQLKLLTNAGATDTIHLSRVRAVFQLPLEQIPWPLPGIDFLLDDGSWIEVRAIDVEPLLNTCAQGGAQVLRVARTKGMSR